MDIIGFEGIAGFLIQHQERAKADLTRYFTTYTGRWFEHFSKLSDPDHLNANDIAACATLSVPLKGKVVSKLMDRASQVDQLLACKRQHFVPIRDSVVSELPS